MFNKKNIYILPLSCWSLLGYKRGVDKYHYSNPKLYLYKNKVFNGFYGSLLYINPFLLFIVINKEFYRLEVYLRDLEEERNKISYYDLF